MRTRYMSAVLLTAIAIFLPLISKGQDVAAEIHSLQAVLDQLYEDMIPLCSKLVSVGRGLAGFGAIWYIGSRVWRQIANAEPIDFYPLLRPFALGFVVMIFPSVLALMNGILKPTVSATAAMVEDSDKAIAVLLQKKEEAIRKTPAWQMYVGMDGEGDRDKWYKYAHPEDPVGGDEGMFSGIGNDIKFAMAKATYSFRNSVKQWMSEILQVLYEAAALCINTIRIFYLIVLAILGPLVIGIAVFDGFQHTLTVWIARYINIFLWLPVANIFGSIIGKVQENMLKLDISQVEQQGDTFFSATDTAYLVFLIIGIVGYLTVPSVANYIVHAGGGHTLLFKVSNLFNSASSTVVSSSASGAGMAADTLGDGFSRIIKSIMSFGSSAPYFDNKDNNSHMRDKLSGKPSNDKT